jgi:lipopolysaccharide export system permease protein
MGKIVHRYLFREILIPFIVGLSVFTFVLLVARLMKLLELVINRGLPLSTVAQLFSYILPAFLEVTVPMAMLLAILVALGRLSADSELVAMRSSGLSLYQLVPPIALFVILTTLATGWLSASVRPWGNRMLRAALWDIARTRASAGLRPQVFNDDFPGLVIYTEHIDPQTDELQNVLISDERSTAERNIIFSQKGLMLSDPEAQTLTLQLSTGWIHTLDTAKQREYQTEFSSYGIQLDLREPVLTGRPKDRDPQELSLMELRRVILEKRASDKPYLGELVEFHRKLAIPFACIVFGLVGIPFGITSARAVRSRGFALSLALIFAYYIGLSAGQALAEQGTIPVIVGLWLPNLLFLCLGITVFRRAAREQPALPAVPGWARVTAWRLDQQSRAAA